MRIEADDAVVLSWGFGVESTALLTRWLREPECRDFPIQNLIVLSAQTGDEWSDSARLAETYVLPELRAHRVRFVELARAGHRQSDGITVLQDSREPTRLHLEGSYKLSDELTRAGTVPQFGGVHRCSLKFKAFVIDTFLPSIFVAPASGGEQQSLFPDSAESLIPANANLRRTAQVPFRHAFGYNVAEQDRIDKSERALAVRYRLAFGFNVEEQDRIARAKTFDSPSRIGWYPLDDWRWDRTRCVDYLYEQYGVRYAKSACSFCPFSSLGTEALARMRHNPEETARALEIEYRSLGMNPRGQLQKSLSCRGARTRRQPCPT